MSDDWDSEDLEEVVYCPRHPKIEATLRCYQCGQPICIKCARRTPVGYICPDCLHGRKANFEQATRRDLISASLVALVLGLLASALLSFSGWFVLFLSPLAGLGIAEVAWRVARRHYSLRLKWAVAGALVLSALPFLVFFVGLTLLGTGSSSLMGRLDAGAVLDLASLIWPIAHLFLMASSAWARLK